MRLLVISASIIIVDQISKYLVTILMQTGQSVPLIKGFLHFTYVLNPGAAFGMLPDKTLFFVIITVLVICLIIYYYQSLDDKHKLLKIALALQLGGAIGNLIDRLFRGGYVVDFIDFKIWPPVFNLADSALVIGITLFIIAFWTSTELQAERSK